MIAFFIELKYYFSILLHLNTVYFLIICYKGKTVCVKLGTKRFTKLIFPRNDYTIFFYEVMEFQIYS
jgi:hypothetical protein